MQECRSLRSEVTGDSTNMIQTLRETDLTFGSRFECKYLVDPILVPEIRQFIQPFMRPDKFAALRPGYRYPICSLYLDTDDLRFYGQVVGGDKKRFKLRARCYSDHPDTPIFLEVKRKINNMVLKRRGRLDRPTAARLIKAGHVDSSLLPDEFRADLEYFSSHSRLTEAKPVCKVRYEREAYESNAGEPVRLTVDTQLAYAVSFDGDLTHGRGPWLPIATAGQILEIKFTDRFPSWIHDLVQMFGLKQQSVPKYILSVDHMLSEGRSAALNIAGFTLPAQRL